MRLIGLLDSPYVRRVAVGLQLLQLRFEHEPISVFRGFDAFRLINPVVKAPTLVCDDGTVLMDSGLILDYAQAQAGRSLLPPTAAARLADLRVTGLGLAACDKSVQLIYEHNLRPIEKQHEPWIGRVTGQLQAACTLLDAELAHRPLAANREHMTLAGITTGVVWHFLQQMLPQLLPVAHFPALTAFSAAAEQLAAFHAAPHGEGVCAPMPVGD